MAAIKQAVLGLGANLGDPIQQMIDARVALCALSQVTGSRCSSMYLSSPVGYSEQPNFINCVLVLKTYYSAQDLFKQMQRIEMSLGRIRIEDNQNAPRLIDIDLLMFGDLTINLPDLIIPHPRMNQRLFVIEPLAELGINIQASPNCDFSDQVIARLAI